MNSLKSKFTKEKFKHLLSMAKSRETDKPVESVDHDWNRPCFNAQTKQVLEKYLSDLTAKWIKELSVFCGTTYKINQQRLETCYAGRLKEEIDTQKLLCFCITTGAKQQKFGCLLIPPATVFSWTARILNDVLQDDIENKEISELESSLLLDIGAKLTQCVKKVFEQLDLNWDGNFSQSGCCFELNGSEEVARFQVDIEEDNHPQTKTEFVIKTEVLNQITGGDTASQQVPREKSRELMIQSLGQIPLEVTVRMAQTKVTLGHVMSLEPGDVLILDKLIGDPVDILLDGKTILTGQPVKTSGNYAVLIAENSKL